MACTCDEIPRLVSLAKASCVIGEYEKAKNIGYLPAWYKIGKALETSNPDQAYTAYLMAARCGNPNAQHQLATWYEKGNARPHIARNKPIAFAWYLLAAEQGLSKAQYHLGTCFLNGDGVTADATQAVRWYTRAAQNNANAAYELGCRYELGIGVTADMKEAVRQYTSAAERGHVEAMNKLVTYYRGTDNNPTLADRWAQIAEAAKQKASEKNDAILERKDEKKVAAMASEDTKEADDEKQESAKVEELSSNEKKALASTPFVVIDESFKEALDSDGLRGCRNTIMQHVDDFIMNPLNNTLDTKRLKGIANVLRIRSGNYRIFIIEQITRDFTIYHIDSVVIRSDAYRQSILARIEKRAQELNKKS